MLLAIFSSFPKKSCEPRYEINSAGIFEASACHIVTILRRKVNIVVVGSGGRVLRWGDSRISTCWNGWPQTPRTDLAGTNSSLYLLSVKVTDRLQLAKALSSHLFFKLTLICSPRKKENLPRIISTADTRGRRRSKRGRSCPKLQSFSPVSDRGTEGLPKACDSNMTLTAAPVPSAIKESSPATWTALSHFLSCTWRYQTARTKKRSCPPMTAIVPTMETPAFEGAPEEVTSHTQAIGKVGFKSLITDNKMKIPETIERAKLTNMKNCLNHRRTQSLLKSFTSARRVPICVALERSESIQIMKKW